MKNAKKLIRDGVVFTLYKKLTYGTVGPSIITPIDLSHEVSTNVSRYKHHIRNTLEKLDEKSI